jgi:flagella synthesis protein FlgN
VQERELLVTSQFHALEAISLEKTTLSDQLEQSAKERISLMNPANRQGDPKQFLQEFLNGCSKDEAEQINSHTKILAEKVALCRDLNSVNGQVISTNLHTREVFVNTITGNIADSLNIYTATGNVKSSSGKAHCQEV